MARETVYVYVEIPVERGRMTIGTAYVVACAVPGCEAAVEVFGSQAEIDGILRDLRWSYVTGTIPHTGWRCRAHIGVDTVAEEEGAADA